MAVGLLLEQSADMADYDPERLRLSAVSTFLESVHSAGYRRARDLSRDS